jgi:hypothetical protein
MIFFALYDAISLLDRPGRDELVVNKDARHVLVMRNGNLYVCDVLDTNGEWSLGQESWI